MQPAPSDSTSPITPTEPSQSPNPSSSPNSSHSIRQKKKLRTSHRTHIPIGPTTPTRRPLHFSIYYFSISPRAARILWPRIHSQERRAATPPIVTRATYIMSSNTCGPPKTSDTYFTNPACLPSDCTLRWTPHSISSIWTARATPARTYHSMEQ